MSKWNPGDVAMVRYLNSDGPWVVGIATTPNGNWRTQEHGATYDIAEARRVAVVDFENREQVERLAEVLLGHGLAFCNPTDVANALREFAKPTPPKPEEPKGRFAEVVDGNGDHWFRLYDYDPSWAPDGEFSVISGWRKWSEFDAVEILSEGVVS